jgi:hypothetical protein
MDKQGRKYDYGVRPDPVVPGRWEAVRFVPHRMPTPQGSFPSWKSANEEALRLQRVLDAERAADLRHAGDRRNGHVPRGYWGNRG